MSQAAAVARASDLEAARTAFRQCELHLDGRRRTLGGGFLSVQALAGRAIADRDAEALHEARALFGHRASMDWSWFWQCEEKPTRADLERAAAGLGNGGNARAD